MASAERELLQRWRRIRGRGEVPLGGDAWVVVKVFACFYPTGDGERAERLMREFELEGGKRVSELSKGMRAKLMLVTAVSHRNSRRIYPSLRNGRSPCHVG